jgi:glycosyltransferase involved in cell wall biosynthesis
MLRPLTAAFRRGPAVPLSSRLRLLAATVRLFFTLRRGGGGLLPVLRFLRSRNFPSQLLLADRRGLVFLTSAPYTYNQSPWVIEIEDPTTLFFPFVHNGMTSEMDLPDSPYFPIVRALLESAPCRAIVTHMRSTARLVATLFRSDAIARKVRYVPLGVKAPARWQRHDEPEPEYLNLLYINSWSQHPGNFQVRGGIDVLEAFSILRARYPHLRLTLRTSMIPLDEHYHRIIESGWVRVIDRFLTTEEMEALHAESHIFLLPAARVHIVSLLQAMAAGLAVVASDGWGFAEYLTHERNGLIVEGRYGKTSWADEEAGMLREDYEPTFSPDPVVVQGIVEAVSRLVEDHALRRRLGRTARHDVETTYSLDNWNQGLKEVFDRALAD